MRLVMMTDMEGCAGINNFHDWVFPGGMFYDTGREILTEEVNAAARAFFENGFEEILVLDAHGHGGVWCVFQDSEFHFYACLRSE